MQVLGWQVMAGTDLAWCTPLPLPLVYLLQVLGWSMPAGAALAGAGLCGPGTPLLPFRRPVCCRCWADGCQRVLAWPGVPYSLCPWSACCRCNTGSCCASSCCASRCWHVLAWRDPTQFAVGLPAPDSGLASHCGCWSSLALPHSRCPWPICSRRWPGWCWPGLTWLNSLCPTPACCKCWAGQYGQVLRWQVLAR